MHILIVIQSDTEAIFGDMNISKELLDELLAIIKRRMTPQPVKIRARKLSN